MLQALSVGQKLNQSFHLLLGHPTSRFPLGVNVTGSLEIQNSCIMYILLLQLTCKFARYQLLQ